MITTETSRVVHKYARPSHLPYDIATWKASKNHEDRRQWFIITGHVLHHVRWTWCGSALGRKRQTPEAEKKKRKTWISSRTNSNPNNNKSSNNSCPSHLVAGHLRGILILPTCRAPTRGLQCCQCTGYASQPPNQAKSHTKYNQFSSVRFSSSEFFPFHFVL